MFKNCTWGWGVVIGWGDQKRMSNFQNQFKGVGTVGGWVANFWKNAVKGNCSKRRESIDSR